ncbi:EexN family lipoprotein [Klebsiella variicola]|uniref:EexN family lipoprotein n=1 Tax=Klebsiella variicola TaxID=244366 RepID=UPI0013D7E907|nr:EexN family lipoprotein [Klebsiella variicola]HBR2692829.1 EexN family lipoprotein [Klebsiella pneumoniae]HDH0806280.1 EexN family lipoprotein [Klebsiella variicola subsp. variicola]MCQ3867668.1 EexN family lipoprotein [Klebsiella variicola]MDP0979214.1 EexN family lipoprotein [Klebsiella variicola]MDP1155524.1 EexN family lipoprotein [Klebsiella variicola]
MLRSLFTLSTLSGVILLSGCKETKSEAWYKQHPDETYAVYTQCLKDGEASDNCEFAQRAAIMFAQIGKPRIKEKFEIIFQQEAEKRKSVTQ